MIFSDYEKEESREANIRAFPDQRMTSTTTIASAASSRLPFVALLCSSFLLNSLIQPQHSFMVLGYSPNIWSPSFAHKNNDKKNNIDSSLSLSSSQNTDDDQSYYGDEASNTTTRKRRGPIRRSRPATGTKSASAQNDSLQIQKEEVQNRHRQALKDPTLLSNQKFNDRTDISPNIKRAITEVMGLSQMTEIQSQTYRAVISGDCVLGRARTGTGKTLAFLLPTIERLLAAPLDLYIPGQSIGCIIVAPTRELAIQIADQAEQLLTYYSEMNVACIYGGTKIQRDYRLLSGGNTGRMPAILVATPGRLLEHLENNSRIIQYGSSRQTKFRDIIDKTQIVILDEADRLFEGFYKDTTKILSFLPRSAKRQTLLFSATLPQRLKVFLRDTMKINFTNIDCVADKDNDVGRASKTGDTPKDRKDTSISSATANSADKKTGETNIRVDQTFWELESMDEYITALVSLIYDTIQTEENYKIIVFFPASKLVRFFSQFFNQGLGMTEVLEIHSRMSQSSRQKASSKFRASTSNSILFTSDVSQRGVDYPDVSHVIQVRCIKQITAFFDLFDVLPLP